MANRFWVGGTGTWDDSDTSHWSASSGGASGASAPTSADDVFINGSSGAGVITGQATADFKSLVCTGYTGSIEGSLGGSGDVTLSSGGTYDQLTLSFETSCSLTSVGKQLFTLRAISGTLTCADSLSAFEIVLSAEAVLLLKNGVTSYCDVLSTPSSGSNASLGSSVGGSQATLSDSSGSNTINRVTVQDIAFDGGATWLLGTNSVDGGNVTGLTVIAAASFDPLFCQSLA
jgi:hypothetical protein